MIQWATNSTVKWLQRWMINDCITDCWWCEQMIEWYNLQRWKDTMIEWLHDMIQARMMKCRNLRWNPGTTAMKQVPQYLLIGDSSLYCKGRWENVERYFCVAGCQRCDDRIDPLNFFSPLALRHVSCWTSRMGCISKVALDPLRIQGLSMGWSRPLLAFFTAGITGFTWRNIKTSSTRQDLASENRILREKMQKKQTEVPWYIW